MISIVTDKKVVSLTPTTFSLPEVAQGTGWSPWKGQQSSGFSSKAWILLYYNFFLLLYHKESPSCLPKLNVPASPQPGINTCVIP